MTDELKKCQKTSNHTTHGMSATNPALYSVWNGMKSRCENKKRQKYKDYGARGISICEEWRDAGAFVNWATKHGYSKGLQIDRINNDGDYSPENCRFVTPVVNSRNRRNAKNLTINGQTKCVSEWCESLPISAFTIYYWFRFKGRAYAEKRCLERIEAWNRRTI